jgi:hypothetical protein
MGFRFMNNPFKVTTRCHTEVELRDEPYQFGNGDWLYYPSAKVLVQLDDGERWRLQEGCMESDAIYQAFLLVDPIHTVQALDAFWKSSGREAKNKTQREIQKALGL